MPDPDLVFSLVNAAVIPAWALLILFPKLSWTQKVAHAALYPLVLGSLYLIYMLYMYFYVPANPEASFMSIKGVQTLFSHPIGMVIGWTHYLVFDLFVGAWIGRDSQRRGINHLAVVPCLLFTFMLGPIGLLMYLLLRKFTQKGGWSLDEGGLAG